MIQRFTPPCGRGSVRRLSGYVAILALLVLTLVAPSAFAQCNVVYTISPQNTSAFGAAISIQNTGTTAWSSWTLTWAFANGQTVSQLWNGIETQSGANVTVKNEPYNGSVAAGSTLSGIGFNGTWNGTTNAVPASFAVNGTTCGAPLTTTTTTLASSSTATTTGTSITLTATVAPSAATGTVTFLDGTTSLGTGTLSSGKATLSTSFSTVGTHSITAVYGGSTTYATSTSSAVSITVSTGTKTATTTALAVSTTTPAVGASVTLTATVSPSTATGTVTFMSGTTSLGTGTLSSGVATLTTSFATAGTDSLTAVYAGSTTFATSTSSAVSINVGSTKTATTTALTASTASTKVGNSVTLTATVAPSTATGTVTFMSGTTSLGTGTLSSGVATLTTSFATAGTYSLTAVYGGSTTFANSTSSAVSVLVSTTTTANTLTASTTTPAAGASVTLTATVSPSAATGTVTFMSGTTSLGTGTLSSGVATLATSFATAGTYSLTAVYAGSPAYTTSTSNAVNITVSSTKTPTTTALTASTTTPAIGASVTLTATVSPSTATGTVTFMSGATSLGTGTLSSGVATLTTSFATAGTDSLTAVYAGSTTFATSTSNAVGITVSSSNGPPAMACNIGYNISSQSSSGNSGSFGAVLTINNTGTTAWTSWTLTWTYANGQTFQSLWGGVVTQTGANVTIVSESYDGSIAAGGNTSQVGFNANWNGVTNAIPTNFAINGTTCSSNGAGGFTLGASASNLAVAEGGSSSDTITVSDFGGFTGSVTLAASSLPTGVTAAFGTNPTTGSSVVTFTAAASLPAGSPTVTINGTSGSTTASTTVTLNIAGFSTVAVNQTGTGPAVSDQILGMDMAAWYDIVVNETAVVGAFQTAGIKAVRWPGGSWSDVYHWQTNTNCQSAPFGGGTPDTNDTFANFVNDLVIPAGLDVALTADYGTNPTCTGGGLPSEAAAWVTNALSLGVTVSHMTVGNEVYGATWEEDLHSPAHDPTTYAASMVGTTGFYQTIKAASPHTLVGVVIDADNTTGGWDNIVLANAKGSYDFVEYHYYPEAPGSENDTTLIHQDAQQLTTNINLIRAELAEWGTPNTPIYVGEIGGPYGNPGKQSMSITQALYAGQVLGEMMNDGVTRLTWWLGFGGCADSTFGANFSSSLYGWQSFGGYMVFSDGLTDFYQCTAETLAPGVLLPTARAFQLFSNVAVNGESVLPASVTGDTTDVVAYAATHSGGTALVLFNRNETTSEPVSITLSAQTTVTSVTVETYNKAIYDLSGSPTGTPPDPAGTSTWAPPTTTTISSPTLPLTLTLTPWSMNVVTIK